jgi:tRNA (guanine-N7-)-methyltransferase
MTPAQARALADLSARYGVPIADTEIDLHALFGSHAPCHLEIGCGNGDCVLSLAQANPGNNYLGIEVHRPGVGSLMLRAAALGLRNLRILNRDAVEAVAIQIPISSIDQIYVFFPDPWPKKRHHKRRLLQPEFIAALRERLRANGRLFIATDWQDYADHIGEAMAQVGGLVNLAAPAAYAPRPAWRPPTRYERRGGRLGHVVRDFVYGRA